MPDELNEPQPEQTAPIYITAEDFATKLSELQDSFTKGINGIAKKFETKLTEKLNGMNQKENDSTKELTIETLKTEYESKLKELEENSKRELESFKSQLSEKERSEFVLKVNAAISTEFAKKGFDDVGSAMDVFKSMHPETNYQAGAEGYIIYSKGTESITLEKLIDTWSRSNIGKRFISAKPIANGSGIQEKTNKSQKESVSDEGLSRTEKILKKYNR